MIVGQVNFDYAQTLTDPGDLLDQYTTLTGWSEALLEAGADRVVVLQRFHRHAVVSRRGVDYHFGRRRDFAAADLRSVEVAHVNGLNFPMQTRRLRALLDARAPILVQDHATGPPPARAASRQVRRWGFGRVDAFLFTAAGLADPWRAARIIRRRHQIHEVLEASTTLRPVARAAAREASGITGSPALLWVGRLNANKDPLTVLAGFERIIVPCPGASLTMVFGSDELLPEVRARLSQSPSLTNRVRLVGSVPHETLPMYYSAADIFVLGSHHEGSGYALIEACACGAIPVVTGIPTFRVITGDGTRGALWTPGDVASLAHALLEMAGRDLGALRADLARHFENELSWAAIGRRALAIYAEERARRQRSH